MIFGEIFLKTSIAVFFYGPCAYIGRVVCTLEHGFIFSCHLHSFHILFISFIYRFYVLRNTQPQAQKVVAGTILVYLPILCIFVLFALYAHDESEVKADLEEKLGYDTSLETKYPFIQSCPNALGNFTRNYFKSAARLLQIVRDAKSGGPITYNYAANDMLQR
nr:7TM GPCR domain containing protein [Haemonchus contortus]